MLSVSILLVASSSMALDLGGVTMPDTLNSGDTELILNGAGLRKKYGFKVYVAGLYLKKKNSDAEAVLKTDEPMSMKMVWRRDVPVKKINKVFFTSFEASAGDKYQGGLKKDIGQFMSWINDMNASKNDAWTYIYNPGKGIDVYVTRAGEKVHKGIITNPEFKHVLFNIWIGKEPCDKVLKKGMMG